MVRYQVFLSFRGPDTRHNLVQYLFERLTHLEVEVFLDCEEIHYGNSIRTSIKAAIEDSDICVPIFSADFASSPACLMEVAQMVELHKKIHPIFFFVKPGDVLHQRGTYGTSFAEHKSKYPESIIKNWEEALKSIPDKRGLEFKKDDLEDALKDALEAALGEFGDIKGTESKKAALEAAVGGINGRFYDALFSRFRELEVFISDLWKHLRDGQGGTQNLVGIDGHVSKMMQKLGFNYQDGRVVEGSERSRRWVVAVGGLPGVGKTTLAKEIYNKIRHLFYGCSFLENVREEIKEKGLVSVQKKLICDLKRGKFQEVQSSGQISKIMQHRFTQDRVLIVLDNVDDSKQIEPLAKVLTWFGQGSRIILTTRKNDVIKHYKRDPEKNEVIDEYEVSTMQPTHALELFYKHAFQEDPAREGYDTLSSEITKAVGYLPFAIEIVGKYLYRKSKYTWMDTPSKLKERGEKQVEPIFQESYELLTEFTQEIFLDIACFFTEVEKSYPCYMWDAKGHFANDGVDDLQNVSFIKIGEKNEFRMHQLLKVFGRETVNKKDRGDPGKRSRLWDYEDFQIILQENEILPCIKEVKALRVTPKLNQDSKSDCFHWKDFRYLPRLMFLDLDGVDIEGNPENVLPNLVWLHWPGCRKKSQLFAFNMGKLVILDLSLSQVQLSLDDWRKLMQKAKLLKVLNAKGCHFISAALEFPDPVPLERLILESCLLVIPTDHLSTYGLLKLISLNINRCKKFKSLPQAMFPLKELKELLIDETDIETLEFEKDSLPALEILSACKCEDLVDVHSITFLKSLQKLTLSSCRILKTLPAAIGELGRLQEMDLSDTLIGELPSSVKDLKNLEVLKMVRTTLEGFPKAIKDLKKLKELDFTNCGSMVGNCNIAGLFSLRILKLKGTRIFPVPARDNGEFCLHNLEVESGDDVQTAS